MKTWLAESSHSHFTEKSNPKELNMDEPNNEPPNERAGELCNEPPNDQAYPEYPLTGIRRLNGKWRYRSNLKPAHLESTIVSDDTIFEKYCAFVRALAELPFCTPLYAKHQGTCTCLHVLRGKNLMLRRCVNAILKDYHMLGSKNASDYYALKTRRHAEVISQLRGAKGRNGYFAKQKLCYLLPQNPFLDRIEASDDDRNEEKKDGEDDDETYCCVWGICALHNWKRGFYDRIRICSVRNNVPPKHRGTGNDNSRRHHAEAYSSLHSFFEDLKEYADPISMRMLSSECGTETRGDVATIALPVHYSKLGLYKQWCFDRGYTITFANKNKTSINPKDKWEARDDAECLPVVSFRSFKRFWDTNFAQLKVRPRGEDTCDKCFVIATNIVTNQKKRKRLEEEIDEEEGCINEAAFEELVHYEEIQLGEAHEHIRQYQAQKRVADEHVIEAIDDDVNCKAMHERKVVFTTDMGQNVSLPHLGSEQFGQAYYMSPLTQYLSGFCSNVDEKMDVFIWGEGDNGRGANQIVSCFYRYLEVSNCLSFYF